MADRIWAGTRALAQRHLDAGQRVWLVTAAPVELGRVIAARLGLTGAIGTVAEVRDGVYTGRLVGDLMHGPAKAEAVTALAAVEGLDLARCAAYSDSVNDLPMLSAVGRAVAVNPDGALLRQARERGWEVRDFRTGRKAGQDRRAGRPLARRRWSARRGHRRPGRCNRRRRRRLTPTGSADRVSTPSAPAHGRRTGRGGAPAACAGSAGWSRGPGRPG